MESILTGLVIEDGRTEEDKECAGWGWGLEGDSLDSNRIAKSKLSKSANATHLKNPQEYPKHPSMIGETTKKDSVC